MNYKEILTIHVKPENAIVLDGGNSDTVVMVPFSGNATGELFHGEILPGGIDTQIIGRFGDRHTLSARYMLEGKDYTGAACKIFVENSGNMNPNLKDILFRTNPKIITDSKALNFLNYDLLVSEGFKTDSGLDIKIYRPE